MGVRHPQSALWPLLLLSGCSLVGGYPPVVAESGVTACHDGVDQDYDGVVDCRDPDCEEVCGEGTYALCRNGVDDDRSGTSDCDDPSCTGLCAEESVVECGDGLDQDGDGLTDLADPSCWPAASTEVTRCASQVGGDWTAIFGGIDGWASSSDAVIAPDPTGRYPHDVLVLPPGGPTASVANAMLVPGAIEGLHAEVWVYVPAVGRASVGLESPSPRRRVPRPRSTCRSAATSRSSWSSMGSRTGARWLSRRSSTAGTRCASTSRPPTSA